MITLPVTAAENILSAILGRQVSIEWIGDTINRINNEGESPKRRGRKSGSKNKVKTKRAGKRKYTKKAAYWKK